MQDREINHGRRYTQTPSNPPSPTHTIEGPKYIAVIISHKICSSYFECFEDHFRRQQV